jgi:hypothetical protein
LLDSLFFISYSFCRVCNKNFQVYAKEYCFVAPKVPIIDKEPMESEKNQDLSAMQETSKKNNQEQDQKQENKLPETIEPSPPQPTSPEKQRLFDDEFIKRQFEVQRQIIQHLISKVKLQEKITVETNQIIKEQQVAFKMLTSSLT